MNRLAVRYIDPGTVFRIALAAAIVWLTIKVFTFASIQDYFVFIVEYSYSQSSIRAYLQFLFTVNLVSLTSLVIFENVVGFSRFQALPKLKAWRWMNHISSLVIIIILPASLLFVMLEVIPPHKSGALVYLSISYLLLLLMFNVIGFILFRTLSGKRYLVNAHIKFRRIITKSNNAIEVVSDWLYPGVAAVIIILYVSHLFDAVETFVFIGGIGVLILYVISCLLVLKLFRGEQSRLQYVFAGAFVLIFVSHFLLPFPKPDFRHSVVAIDDNYEDSAQALKLREIPDVGAAFEDWIKHRPQFNNFDSKKSKYPIYIVAAQGGGQYAAYHTALVLARLYDQCPGIKNHIFAISAVSGGSVGSAVLSEAIRNAQLNDTRCESRKILNGEVESVVEKFFSHDFTTPVIANGLFVDIPSLVIPQFKLRPNRAIVLEEAFERGWRRSSSSEEGPGLGRPFYGTWSPKGGVPALFFNTTSINYGLPTIISQLNIAEQSKDSIRAFVVQTALRQFDKTENGTIQSLIGRVKKKLHTAIGDGITRHEYTRPKYFNILQFRPDIQMKLSTAATLSARFPYVTPPGRLSRGPVLMRQDQTLRETKVLQLIDGGFSDNSGIRTAVEIVKHIRNSKLDENILSKVEFHIIAFGHAMNIVHSGGDSDAQSEVIAPIATFDAVRQASRVNLNATQEMFNDRYLFELFDHDFQAPLSWTLSETVRAKIRARSGGGVSPSLCCRIGGVPNIFYATIGELVVDLGVVGKLLAAAKTGHLVYVAPNQMEFDQVIQKVRIFKLKQD